MDATTNTFTADTKLHFLDYWRIIRIRKTVIFAVLLLVVITTTTVTFFLPESYMSTVRIAVDKDVSDVSSISGAPNYSGYDPYFILTEFEKIKSKAVLYQVIDNLKLNERWGRSLNAGQPLKTSETFTRLRNSQLEVVQSRNTSLIEIKVYSEDKNEAAEIANEIARVYRETRLAQRSEMSEKGINVLKGQLANKIEAVRQAQATVDKLRQELGISDIDAPGMTTTMEPETLRRFEAQRIEALLVFTEMNTLLTEMTGNTKQELRKTLPSVAPDAQLNSLLDQLSQTEQKLATLMKDLGDENPDVQRIAALLVTINTQVDARVEGIMKGLASRVASARAKLDALTKAVVDAKALEIETTRKNRTYFEEKTNLEEQRQVRRTLELKIIQEELDRSMTRSSVVVVTDKAEPGLAPVRPNKPLNISLGLFVGLVMGVALAFFIEYLDTSVKTLDDVERALQSPVLGVIPQNVGSLLDEGPESPHAESYRVLRSNMMFSKKDAKFNTLAITSGGAGEGKSTTIFNLATIFAQNGQRVIIVDSDLRRPSIHKYLKISNTIGLTNYLQRQNTLEEVIQTTSLSTLDFMPSGKLPSSSMGILNSVQMKALIHELKRRYDFVFFDSPPILGVSDASILASEVDMTLLVVQYRKYPQAMTLRAKQMIEKVGGNLLGVVLNNINMAHDSYYYYYSGFYSSYYAPHEDVKPVKLAGSDHREGEEQARLEQKY